MTSAWKRVCLVRGEGVIAPLVMDSYERAFKQLGLETRVLDIGGASRKVSSAEMRALEQFEPQLAVSYGFTGLIRYGDGQWFRHLGVPLAILHYDCPFFRLSAAYRRELTANASWYHQFVWDDEFLSGLAGLGMPNLHPIMLAADPEVFGLREPRPRFDVTFVGRAADPSREVAARQAKLPKALNLFLDELIDRKLQGFSLSVLDHWNELARSRFPSMRADWAAPSMATLYYLVHLEGSARLRRAVLEALSGVRVDSFGGDWSLPNVTDHPALDWAKELPAVYADSRINLNISSLQLERSVNNRIFDVAAVGGFLLTDPRDDLKKVFSGFEAMTYRSYDDLREKVAYFLSHDSERRELAAELQKAVLASHTYAHRAQYLLDTVTSAGGMG